MENCQTPKSVSLLTAARHVLAQPSRNDLHFTAQFSIEMGTELLSLRPLPTSRKISRHPGTELQPGVQADPQLRSAQEARSTHTDHPAQPQPVLETANLTNAISVLHQDRSRQPSLPFPSFDPLHPFRGKDHSF